MSNVKDSILALFDDNVVGAISASDMRIFVESIFDSKENEIHIFENLGELETYRLNSSYPIEKFDVIVITDHNNLNQVTNRGIYIALKDNPGQNDVFKVGSENYDDFLKLGNPAQLISLDSNKKLTWIEPLEGYYLEGTAPIRTILDKLPVQKGPVWIAEDDDISAPIPGKKGDGYSWDGNNWINVGQIRGPEGDILEVSFASQYEVDGGYVETKAISPKTLKNSSHIKRKENGLGNPINDYDMLISTKAGVRSWEKPIRLFNDIQDVDVSQAVTNSFIYYNGIKWVAEEINNVLTNTFIDLNDTPISYQTNRYKGVMVNPSENGLEFTDLVTNSRELSDFTDTLPSHNQILRFNGGTMKWEPSNSNISGTSASRPINPLTGEMFFDININKPIWWNGSVWVDSMGNNS